MSAPVFVAIGSNLPGPAGQSSLDTCRWAVDALAAVPGLVPSAVSAWYRSHPIPASNQPDYVNGVARFTSALDPAYLLATLHAIEAEAGRVRSVPNAARVLDLDLLAIGDRVIRSPTLILPHPRLQDRAFVLDPLCDVAPDWRHPTLHLTAAQLRRVLPEQAIERLPI